MAEYGPGLTLGQEAMLDKERVRHALRGELVNGEGEGGFTYAKAPKTECDRYILGVVDKWYYHAKQLADSARSMERVASRHGLMFGMAEIVDEMSRASTEFDDYRFEGELDVIDDAAAPEGLEPSSEEPEG